MTEKILAKFVGKGICANCHGRGTVYRTHILEIGVDDPCVQCSGQGFVVVACNTEKEADELTAAFELQHKKLNDDRAEISRVSARLIASIMP